MTKKKNVQKTCLKVIKEELEFLANITPGTVWTEYHWRGVCSALICAEELEDNEQEGY